MHPSYFNNTFLQTTELPMQPEGDDYSITENCASLPRHPTVMEPKSGKIQIGRL